MQSYLSALCVHSRLANVLLRFNLDNKFQSGGRTESYVHEQTLENQSRQLPESALSTRSPQILSTALIVLLFTLFVLLIEPRVGKVPAKRLEGDSRSRRNCRHIYSLMATTIA